ncbi:MAG: hypothetical protein FWE22_00215 [Firmicutes bacterium]|nr:hypothetical protein [Bacillota bacterium]
MKDIFSILKSGKNIVTINLDNMTKDEYLMLSSLQGIVAQDEARIVIITDNYQAYVDYLVATGEYTSKEYKSVWDIVSEFKSAVFEAGYVLFDSTRGGDINSSMVVSGVERFLAVPVSCEEKAIKLNFVKKFDFADIEGNETQRKRKIFELYKDRLNKGALIHQPLFMPQLRDFAVALKLFCFYTDEHNAEDVEFRNEIFKWADDNIPVMGWTDDEIKFVAECSEFGKFVIPMDWSSNTSFLAGVRIDKKLKQKTKPNKIKAEKGKHYLAICVSDGDNIQWCSRNFATTSTFGQRLRGKRDYKVSWTFPPYMARLGAVVTDYTFDLANEFDSFIAGVSGAGYINSTTYPIERLDAFTNLTSQLMTESDMTAVVLLDNLKHVKFDGKFIAEERLRHYAKQKNISGGVWEIDPDRYESGKGEIFWSEGKPFLSVRLSLWHPSNQTGQITKEWLDGYIDAINNFEADPTSASGYTVLNIHPWTVEMEHVEYIVSKLKKHVEIVSVDEIVEIAKQNIRLPLKR